jgi:F-type H+-transporting ATPase subunit b
MPQFDPEVFSSQIFWLVICFSILYFFVSKIIIPRVNEIISNREMKISEDESSAISINQEILKLENTSKNLREKANSAYQKSIDAILKDCALKREKLITKTKEDISKLDSKSQKKISNFIDNSREQINISCNEVAQIITKKILGIETDKEISVKLNKS